MCADYCLHNFSYIADKGCGLAIVNYLQLTQTRTVSDCCLTPATINFHYNLQYH